MLNSSFAPAGTGRLSLNASTDFPSRSKISTRAVTVSAVSRPFCTGNSKWTTADFSDMSVE
jgi:hypothetical protein